VLVDGPKGTLGVRAGLDSPAGQIDQSRAGADSKVASSGVARFRAIYRENYPRILGYALRRTESPEDAADVVAETFLTAWRRFDDMPDGPEARLWLYGVARRVLANHRRGIERRHRLHMALRADAASLLGRHAAPAHVADSAVLEVVAEAFARLEASDRELLSLLTWEELSYDEIASVLGCTQGAARIRVHRARRRLAIHLARLGIDVKQNVGTGHALTNGPSPVPTVEERC